MKVTVDISDELVDIIMAGPMPSELDNDASLQERLDFMAELWGIGFQLHEEDQAEREVRQKLYATLGMEIPGDHSWWPPEDED